MATNKFLNCVVDGIIKDAYNNTNFNSEAGGTSIDPTSNSQHLHIVLISNANGLSGNVETLASSTALKTDMIKVNNNGTITIDAIPYGETFANNDVVTTQGKNAGAFALVKCGNAGYVQKQVSIPQADGNTVNKYICTQFSSTDVLFTGQISGGQSIGQNNSFNLSGISLTIN